MNVLELEKTLGPDDFIVYYISSIYPERVTFNMLTPTAKSMLNVVKYDKLESECISADLYGNTSESRKCYQYNVYISRCDFDTAVASMLRTRQQRRERRKTFKSAMPDCGNPWLAFDYR